MARWGFASAKEYLTERQIFQLIRRIPRSWPKNPQEVHVLVGAGRIPMMLWMAASLMTASKTRWKFVVHDDGTMQEKDEAMIAASLPGCRIVRCAVADAAVQKKLRKYPLLANYRSTHAFGKRLTDFAYFNRSKKVVSIDSDILFFRNPNLFFEKALESCETSVFLRDLKNTSLIKNKKFAGKTGKKLAQLINAGIFSVPKHFMSMRVMEDILENYGLLNESRNTWFVEQTVIGALASLQGKVELLPKNYVLSLDQTTRPDSVMRHYVGPVRHLFYSEGIPKIRNILKKLEKNRNALVNCRRKVTGVTQSLSAEKAYNSRSCMCEKKSDDCLKPEKRH